MAVFGSTDAYKVTGPMEITVDLPQYSILFREQILSAVAIMPEHAYKDIKPEAMRGHVASTWLGTYTVKTSAGASFTAHGGIGTGPWIPAGYDASRKAYKYTRNEKYWKPMPGNVKTFYIVNINGTDAVLSALKSGDIDAHDPMYDIGSLLSTIDPSWGKVQRFDSYKWQHVCYNLRHPVFGTGGDTARQAGPVTRLRGGGLYPQGDQLRDAARTDRAGDRRRLGIPAPSRCRGPHRNTTTTC